MRHETGCLHASHVPEVAGNAHNVRHAPKHLLKFLQALRSREASTQSIQMPIMHDPSLYQCMPVQKCGKDREGTTHASDSGPAFLSRWQCF